MTSTATVPTPPEITTARELHDRARDRHAARVARKQRARNPRR